MKDKEDSLAFFRVAFTSSLFGYYDIAHTRVLSFFLKIIFFMSLLVGIPLRRQADFSQCVTVTLTDCFA